MQAVSYVLLLDRRGKRNFSTPVNTGEQKSDRQIPLRYDSLVFLLWTIWSLDHEWCRSQ